MATDATGTPTSPDSIPKYNTAVDAPSGKGFNAAMDQIQVGLSARASKPASIASGEVPVWNGSAWVRSTTTNIGPTSLGSGSPSATTVLFGDGTWKSAAYQSYTPTWTSSGTAPAIGNAIVVSQYVQIGKMVHAYGHITFGSTSTFGTGNYSFALPVTASTNAVNSSQYGWGMMYDSSAAVIATGVEIFAASSTTLGFHYGATYLGTITVTAATAPWTWTQSDEVKWNITYEAA